MPTTTLLRHLDVVTLDDERTILRDADLVVRDGRIAALGQAPPELEPDETIDASGRIALPGLINAHCHSPMTLLRGVAEDLALSDWLSRIWRIENELEPEDIYWGAALAAVEMIETGTVAFHDMYFCMDRVAEVVVESGLKATLGATLFDAGEGTDAGEALEPALAWNAQLARLGEPRLRTVLAPHAPYTCSPPLLRAVVEAAHRTGAGVHLHVAEDRQQVDDSLALYELTPVRLLASLGVFDVPGGCVAAHALVLDHGDVETLATHSVTVAHCPITYAKLAMPVGSLRPLLDAGVDVVLGSDGVASNGDMDLFAVVRQTALLQKLLSEDPGALPGDLPLRMATGAGARAIGFPDSGVLRVGAAADLVLIDGDAPHLRPQHDLVANLVHAAKGRDVTDTMVDGRWLMRDRELLTLDRERILAEAQARAERLLGSAGTH